ncbi:MAG: cysteine--tRNA ligase [Thermodesulfobacteria bacterium]|nr:cysteine--tRNA ligase [Thermodesulfobacteriota bacterium]
MTLRIYNTLTRKKQDFVPIEKGRIGIYVCGITAYDRCHIGHARSAVVFDVIVRFLRSEGFDVTFVRNFTDIDDKIINRAREEGISTEELAEREIGHFYEDMDALGVLRADVEPRATEHMPEIVSLIERLIDRGFAYESGGDVYFSVRKFPDYGKLSGRDLEQLMAGARIMPGEKKEDPLDFALWKGAKPGEPSWDSPWGKGRPGWHIECSAMSMKYLGETFDIHGGGLDLAFPHHENEIAQSEAATGKQFVRYWVHNGFVTIKGEKMSKSLGNFITIKDILANFHPEALRLFLLSKHYRSPLDYSPESLKEATSALDRCYKAVFEAAQVASVPVKKQRPIPDEAREAADSIAALREQVVSAMRDDFNTAKALGHFFDGVRALNRIVEAAKKKPSALYKDVLDKSSKEILDVCQIFGILGEEPGQYIHKRNLAALESSGLSLAELESLIEERGKARREKDWNRADEIRNMLAEKGIVLQDTPQGTVWSADL